MHIRKRSKQPFNKEVIRSYMPDLLKNRIPIFQEIADRVRNNRVFLDSFLSCILIKFN